MEHVRTTWSTYSKTWSTLVRQHGQTSSKTLSTILKTQNQNMSNTWSHNRQNTWSTIIKKHGQHSSQNMIEHRQQTWSTHVKHHQQLLVRIDSSTYAKNTYINIHRYLAVFNCFWAIREVAMVQFCAEFDFLQNSTFALRSVE
jgi:NAD-dependent oxidoreductase involved in siderophore biosynthesis